MLSVHWATFHSKQKNFEFSGDEGILWLSTPGRLSLCELQEGSMTSFLFLRGCRQEGGDQEGQLQEGVGVAAQLTLGGVPHL